MGQRRQRVLLVDDHEVVRESLKALLAAHEWIDVVGQAATSVDAVAEADRCRPDIVIMDVQLREGSGIEATREIMARQPACRVVMLTSFSDEESLFASVMAGAAGYVLKHSASDELVRALRAVSSGASMLDPTVTSVVLDRVRKHSALAQDERLGRLSGQEERILALMAEGMTNRQIAENLHLSDKTVKNYVSSVLQKLEVQRRAEAAAYLARHGRHRPP